MRTPLRITLSILHEAAICALELNDPKLIAIMCRLTLYAQSDPYDKAFDAEATEKAIKAGR